MASDTEAKEQHKADQAYVRKSIAAACVVYACIMTTAYYAPIPKPHLPTAVDRLAYTLRWQMISALVLFAGIMWAANTRLRTAAIDPLNKEAEKFVALPSRFLQNTLEQFVLSFVGNLTLSTYLSAETMHVMPALVITFVVARVAFGVGYSRFQLQRAFGFALTVCPTMSVYLYCVYCFLVYGFAYSVD